MARRRWATHSVGPKSFRLRANSAPGWAHSDGEAVCCVVVRERRASGPKSFCGKRERWASGGKGEKALEMVALLRCADAVVQTREYDRSAAHGGGRSRVTADRAKRSLRPELTARLGGTRGLPARSTRSIGCVRKRRHGTCSNAGADRSRWREGGFEVDTRGHGLSLAQGNKRRGAAHGCRLQLPPTLNYHQVCSETEPPVRQAARRRVTGQLGEGF
eukprot:4089974-Pleurochrysis_carterae.AAC.1